MNTENTTEIIRQECHSLAELLIAKHQNYGGSAFQAPILNPLLDPETAMKVRLSDKIARLRNLELGDQDRVGESRLDTLLDIAGYAILIRTYDKVKGAKESSDGQERVQENVQESVQESVQEKVQENVQEKPKTKRFKFAGN